MFRLKIHVLIHFDVQFQLVGILYRPTEKQVIREIKSMNFVFEWVTVRMPVSVFFQLSYGIDNGCTLLCSVSEDRHGVRVGLMALCHIDDRKTDHYYCAVLCKPFARSSVCQTDISTDVSLYGTVMKKKIPHRQKGPLRGNSSLFGAFEPPRVRPNQASTRPTSVGWLARLAACVFNRLSQHVISPAW